MNQQHRPRLRHDLRVDVGRGGEVFLHSEQQVNLLNDPLYAQLLPRLTGHHTLAEIIEQLQAEIPVAYIHYGLKQLQQQGYLDNDESEPSVGGLSADLAIACHHLRIDPQMAAKRLQTTRVGIRALGSVAAVELATLVQAQGIQTVVIDASPATTMPELELEIVLCDDYLQPELETLNKTALEQGRPWLLTKPAGSRLWLGPLFVPPRTACWACLAQRLRGNRPVETYLGRQTDAVLPLIPPLTLNSASLQTALGIIATAVFKWIVQGQKHPAISDRLLTYDTLAPALQHHAVIRRPQCPCCGRPPTPAGSRQLPLILGHRRKRFTADGGHRTQSPETVFAQYQHQISPLTGVVRAIAKHPHSLDPWQHTYVAKHDFRSIFDDWRSLRANLGGRSGGKGRTAAQAKMSALGEAIERYSAVFQGDEPRRNETYLDLGDAAIHPNDCMNFSPQQYAAREQWNRGCEQPAQHIPVPFDPERQRDWTPVWSLTQAHYRYLPTAYCYFGSPKPAESDAEPDCWADTNGCAAGSTLEEAILQGFMELVERDAIALWWYNRLSKPAVDLASFNDPDFQALQERYATLQRELWVLDITSDLEIPSFVALSRCHNRPTEDILFGFGAHFDAQLAIGRALTELNQILPAVLPSHADGSSRYALGATALNRRWWQTATLANEPYLAPAADGSPQTAADYPKQWSDDLLDDIRLCQKRVENKGLELLVLDQTRPDVGLNVAKVIVPGLRHHWRRLGPGRLYTVPVAMGWCTAALEESALNPWPVPI
ncbi:MAG: TOMM precursor leader peptide-binding protein [Cyanobacteria bacterium P01_G01_bin.54]